MNADHGRGSLGSLPAVLAACAGVLACAGSLPPPTSPTLTSPSSPPFVNGGTGANATSTCGAQAVAVGLVVAAANTVDSVRLLCKPLSDAIDVSNTGPGTPAADPIDVTQPEGDALPTTLAAPPGYALAGVDVQTCIDDDRRVIGRIRPVYKGVEAYGLHQTTIPGPWLGRLCRHPLFDDVHRLVGQHDGLGLGSLSVNCSGFGNDFALVRLDGQVGARLTDLSGLCAQVTPAKVNPATRPRIPSWSWSAAAVQTAVLLAPARTTNVAKMTAPAGTLVTGFERLVATGSGYSHDTIYPFDALGVNGWGADLTELVAGPQFGHAGPILSQGAPGVGDAGAWDTPCDRGYVLVGMFGITSDTRMPNLNGNCVPFDIENQARSGQVLLPSLSAWAADLYSTGIGGSLPSGEAFFPAPGQTSNCGVDRFGKLQQVRGFTWEWSDDHHARVVTSLLCDTVVVTP